MEELAIARADRYIGHMASSKLKALVDQFVDGLHELFVEEAGAALRSTLSNGTPTTNGAAHRKPGRPAKAARAGKRSPEQIDAQAERLLTIIKDNPGKRSEDLAGPSKLTTSELVAPIKRLLQRRAISAEGKARGTRYTAVAAKTSGSKKAGKASAKKAAAASASA
jgi:hypothetical protein